MAAAKKRLSVKEAFRLAQQPHQNQAKLVVALSRTYGAVSGLASAPALPSLATASGLSLPPLRDPQGRSDPRVRCSEACPRSPGLCQ